MGLGISKAVGRSVTQVATSARDTARLTEVSIGLEVTRLYWLSLNDVLTSQGYPVSVINPFANLRLPEKRGAKSKKLPFSPLLQATFFPFAASLGAQKKNDTTENHHRKMTV